MSVQQRYDRSDIRRLNAISVLNELRNGGQQSRANISANLGLTRATVSNIVADLINASLIYETEYTEGGAGRPGLLLSLNPNCGTMIGVEIDLGSISLLLTDMGQEVLWQTEVPFKRGASAKTVLKLASKLVDQALARGKEKQLNCLGICVAWAGLVERKDGELSYSPAFGWERVPLQTEWEATFGVPVYIQNEAHAGAIGAYYFGAHSGTRNFIYLSVGIGLAAGIFIDGELMQGRDGYAGQVGHASFADNGIECTCGKTGCWVTEVGISALQRKLTEQGINISEDINWYAYILEKARAGDPQVMAVLDEVGEKLGIGIARLAQVFNPSIVIVGGQFGDLLSFAKGAAVKAIRADSLPHLWDGCELAMSYAEDDRLKGCIATVFDATMKDPPIKIEE